MATEWGCTACVHAFHALPKKWFDMGGYDLNHNLCILYQPLSLVWTKTPIKISRASLFNQMFIKL